MSIAQTNQNKKANTMKTIKFERKAKTKTSARKSVKKVKLHMLIQGLKPAGVQHADLGTVADKVKIGDELTITWERTNRFDARALRIDWKGVKIGYIPAKDPKYQDAIFAAHKAGHKVSAKVSKYWPSNPTWEMLQIDIFIDSPVVKTAPNGDVAM